MSCFYHRVLIVAAKCELVYVYEICCETAIRLRVRLLCNELKIATKKPPKQRVEIAISLGIPLLYPSRLTVLSVQTLDN